MLLATILLVEGVTAGSKSLAPALLRADYNVIIATTGNAAIKLIDENTPDLAIVDASTMRSNGVRITMRLRKRLGGVSIIHCRNRDQDEDRSAQADIYLAQPFTSRKVLNRVRALLPANDLTEEIVRAGHITYYVSKRSVEVRGLGESRLTPKMACLLEALLQNPGQSVSREQLMRSVWNTEYFGDTRTLDVHIRWLRERIEKNPAKPVIIKTVRGVGYIFKIPPERSK